MLEKILNFFNKDKISEAVDENCLCSGNILEMKYGNHDKWLYVCEDNHGIKVFPLPPLKNPDDAVLTIIKDCEFKNLDFKVVGNYTPQEWKEHMEKCGYRN